MHKLVTDVGVIAREYFDQGVEAKHKTSKADLITIADESVNQLLVSGIQRAYPEHGIYSEELNEVINPNSAYQWVIDPIDGTRNFAYGITSWCIMLALLKDKKPVHSVVYQPVTGELFYAEAGRGAYKNGNQIFVNDVDSMHHALGILCCDSNGVELERYRQAMLNYVHSTGWLHNHGSMLSACHLAAGAIDFLLNNYGYAHDYWPVYLICEEAGAVITNSNNQPWTDVNRDIVIANPNLHSSVMDLFESPYKILEPLVVNIN